MKLYTISIQSLRRRKSRTAFLLFGLILSIALVIMLITLSESINASVSQKLDEFGANIIVTPKSEQLLINYGGMIIGDISYNNSQLKETDIARIRSIKNSKNISTISPKLLEIADVNGKKTIIAGIIFENELRLKKWWHIKGNIPESKNQILIGNNVSTHRQININDTIKIKNEIFVVSGILDNTGSQDDDFIFMNLSSAQKLFNKPETISLIEISALCYDCPIEEIVAQTSKAIPAAKVTPIKQTIEARMSAVHSFEHFSIGISMIILVISFLIVFINVNASVNERTKEIGIFKSVGFRQIHILKIILFEIFIISLISGLAGYFIGTNSAKFLLPHLSMFAANELIIRPILLWETVLLSLIVSLLACIYPALKAAKLDPTVAFRYI